MNEKLIVYHKQDNFKYLPIIGAPVLFLYVLRLCKDSWMARFLSCLVLVYLILMIFGVVYYFFYLRSNKIAAILDKDGLWTRRHGLIAWNDVKDVFIYRTPTTPIESVAFYVKDRGIISQQSTFGGKCSLFWAKVFGFPDIILSDVEIENEVVVSFAKRFIKL